MVEPGSMQTCQAFQTTMMERGRGSGRMGWGVGWGRCLNLISRHFLLQMGVNHRQEKSWNILYTIHEQGWQFCFNVSVSKRGGEGAEEVQQSKWVPKITYTHTYTQEALKLMANELGLSHVAPCFRGGHHPVDLAITIILTSCWATLYLHSRN